MIEFLEPYVGKANAEIINQFFPPLMMVLIGIIIIKIIMRIVDRAISKSKLRKGLHKFIAKTIKVILYSILILIVADMLNIPVTSLLATFSVVGLAASLAIQDTLSNLASGVMVLVTHPFKTGDWVDVANVSGTVKEITFNHTVITTLDNKVIRVPNKEVVGATIVNYSENKERRLCLSLDVSYNAPTKKVLEVLNQLINEAPYIIKEKEIFVKLTAYKDSSIEYTIRVWTKNEDYWNLNFYLLEKVRDAFDANGIEIPYNQLDVHVHNV
ncbi:MAG: mechanosensitive ion channel family protein [Clostridia bacterium]|nr:mechanosensitive ion channel family protein [Clostridia bacterium]